MTDVPRVEGALPRVLVVSHQPFSDLQSNGKTLSAFFEGWAPERLAQLFFTMDAPAFSVCNRFFRITDLDVLKTMLGKRRPGARVTDAEMDTTEEHRAELHRRPLFRVIREIFQRRSPLALILRSMVWGRRWSTPELERWLDEFDPQVVLFQSSNCTFAFEIVAAICETRGIPLVLETTDDYVTAERSFNPFARLYHRQIHQAYKAAVDKSTVIIAIGQKMAREYATRFGGRYVVAMNSVAGLENQDIEEPKEEPYILHFAGNLGLNRWKVLNALGAALDRLHASTGIDARLEIFSLVKPPSDVLDAFACVPRVAFLGSADAHELAARRAASTVLVHVESFDRKNRGITRLSISTKVPEYLAANRAILAIGPGDVASIEYLAESAAAEVVTSLDVDILTQALVHLLGDAERRRSYSGRGAELVEAHHLRDRISAMVRDEILEAVSS